HRRLGRADGAIAAHRSCAAALLDALVAAPAAVAFVALEALLPPQVATIFKHVPRVGVQRPEAALAGLVRCPRYFEEAVIEAERVANGVLPSLLVLPVVGKE